MEGRYYNYRNVAQLVERTLWERGVTGSNPAIPTKKIIFMLGLRAGTILLQEGDILKKLDVVVKSENGCSQVILTGVRFSHLANIKCE